MGIACLSAYSGYQKRTESCKQGVGGAVAFQELEQHVGRCVEAGPLTSRRPVHNARPCTRHTEPRDLSYWHRVPMPRNICCLPGRGRQCRAWGGLQPLSCGQRPGPLNIHSTKRSPKPVLAGTGDKAKDVVDTGKQKAEEAGDKVGDFANKAGDKASNAADKAGDKASSTADKAKSEGSKAGDKLSSDADKAGSKAQSGADRAKGEASKAGNKASGEADKAGSKAQSEANKAQKCVFPLLPVQHTLRSGCMLLRHAYIARVQYNIHAGDGVQTSELLQEGWQGWAVQG